VGRREPSAGRCAGLDCVRLPAYTSMLRTPVGGNFLACIQRSSVELAVATRFGTSRTSPTPFGSEILSLGRSARITQ
jgi:hypothetical protein